MNNLTPAQQADLRTRIRFMLPLDIGYEEGCDLADDIADMVIGWMKINVEEKSDDK